MFLDTLALILYTEIRNLIVGPLYVFKHMAYGFFVEEIYNDGDHMRRIICSVIVMFFMRK